MRLWMIAALSAGVLGACSPAADPPPPVATAPVVADPPAAGARVAVPQPSAGKVLQDIYGVAFKNPDEERLDGGVVAGYWADAVVPDAAPAPVFVALASETPGPEQEYPKDSDPVHLSGAIYVQDAAGQWQLKAAQMAFGRFGAKEQAPVLGDSAASVWLKVADGKVIWAVPTVVPAMGGARVERYELVGVDWKLGKLAYLGVLPAGESAPVDCKADAKPDAPMACYGWKTQLSVAASAASGEWPGLEAARSGTRYDDARKAVVSLEEHSTYGFDATKGVYITSKK